MGQIKNIKLHIVTDIKKILIQNNKTGQSQNKNMEYQADTQFEQVDPYAPPTKRQRPAVDSRISEQDDVVVLKEKVIIPVDKYPGHNFVGSIIGPSGSILKELTKQTKSKIAILGKGSMKDKEKEKELM